MISFTSTQTKPPTHLLHSQNLPPFSQRTTLPSLIKTHSRIHVSKRSKNLKLRVHASAAADGAQPYDREPAQQQPLFSHKKPTSLKIAVVGFGNFGQFLAKAFVRQGHTVLAHSRSDYSATAQKLGVAFFSDPDDLCEQHPEVVVLCTSILSTEKVIKTIPFQRLRRNTLFVDVLSVKEFPRDLLLSYLPPEFDILCTHPMFGPQSGKFSWVGLPFVFDRVRIGPGEYRADRCDEFLGIFAREGCRMVEMSCAEHDRFAAGSQFVTHTMGRVLERFGLESSPINTKGYETLLNLVHNTAGDSFDLYYGLFMYNKNAMEQLERLDMAFEGLKKELFGNLHEVCRKQLFGHTEGITESITGERPEKVPKFLPASPRSAAIDDQLKPRSSGVHSNGAPNGSAANGSLKLSTETIR
ncbi:Prephenate dehydrogenase/arogenate dehydrogenase [Parasponia andersonii]|uniref:Prephenate dehydrogenase/arogenate dehydrogenase n=1 Tax=Parasponia andersonii TaxID=3476 RepID=A0A2P5AHG2_PARAD|nr:Prephenate dehydrogenase/arogenate dehydrogenase [Parasponia andersonii]